MQFNSDQTAAIEGVVKGFLERNLKGATIVGEGGTGKSTCVMDIVRQLREAGLKVLLTAPTNKAVKQLEKSARGYGLQMDDVAFQTIHSALGLAMLPNEENKRAVRRGKGVFPIFDVVVVDEASMLSKYALHDHLLPEAQVHDVKILFMGDDMQLPPVKETRSLAFDIFDTFRLTKVERQDEGSGILEVTSALRMAINAGKNYVAEIPAREGVEVIKAAEFLKSVVSQFSADTDLDEQRVLAWRNNRVDEINNAIRRSIYGKAVARFEVGERVVTGAPIGDGEVMLLSTDEECIVNAVRESELLDEDSGQTFRTWMLVLNPIHAEVSQVFAHVLHEAEEDRYWERLRELATKAKSNPTEARIHWARYHKFKDLFASIRYCYCITVHRSQGSTYRRVFVDVNDILSNRIRKERQSLLYVAYSRPSQQLVINKARFVA